MSEVVDPRSTTTPNLGLVKPDVQGDDGLWGPMLNQNADVLDQVIPLHLLLTGGVVTGSVSIGAAQPNYVTIAGGTSGNQATIQAAGATGDLYIGAAYNGRVNTASNRNYPTPTAECYRFDVSIGGTVASGQTPIVEMHAVNSDAVDASLAQGGGLTWFQYPGVLNAGAVGGRTAFGATIHQAGVTTLNAGQYYLASAFWATAAHSAGGTAGGGNARGSLFASNDGTILQNGAGAYWTEIVGYELDIGAEAGTGLQNKQGIKVVLWSTDAVAGAGGCDYAYSMAAQANCAGWDRGYCFGSPDGWWPMKAISTLIGTVPGLAGGPAYQAQYGVDFSSVSFSQDAFRSAGFAVDGSGDIQTRALYVGANVASIDNTGRLTLSGGATFGTQLVSSNADLSKHLDLYGGEFGVNITSGSFNFVSPAGGSFLFLIGGSGIGWIDAAGLQNIPIGTEYAQAGYFTTVRTGGTTGPTWTSGSAAPAATAPVGSLYSRVGGPLGATLYVSRGAGTWAAVAGV
jgi:hypothetical protein